MTVDPQQLGGLRLVMGCLSQGALDVVPFHIVQRRVDVEPLLEWAIEYIMSCGGRLHDGLIDFMSGQRLTSTPHDGAKQRVSKLPNVSGPAMPEQALARLR